MKHITRRTVLATALTLATLSAGVAMAQANYPDKPIRMVIAFPPGGPTDLVARVLAQKLTEQMGQPVVVDNKPGANGNIAAELVTKAPSDGYTLFYNTSAVALSPALYKKMSYDVRADFAPVALTAVIPLVLAVHPSLPVNTVQEFVQYAKANPDKLSYGSAGNGTTPHVGGELFKQNTGIFATHIPYRGAAPAIQDVMAGQIDYAFAPGTVFQSVKAGKLKLLAVASHKRTDNYPSAPTVEEEGFGKVYVDTPFAIYAPAAMPQAQVMRMNREVNRLLAMPAIKARFAEFGADAQPLSPAELKALVQAEIALFGPVIRKSGIKAD